MISIFLQLNICISRLSFCFIFFLTCSLVILKNCLLKLKDLNRLYSEMRHEGVWHKYGLHVNFLE